MPPQFWPPTVRRGGQYLDIYSSMLEDGIIFVNAPIDQHAAGLIASSLLYLNSHGEKTGQAKIYLNTKEGDLVAAMSVVDIMEIYKRKQVEVQTFGFGDLGVAAALIVAAGSARQRKVAFHCQLSLHVGLDTFQMPNVKSAEMQSRQGAKITTQYLELLAAYTGQTLDALRFRINSEEYLNAADAKRMGLVDDVI